MTQPLTILFGWELGGGLGHMMQIVPLARELVRRGHRVFVALRHVSAAETAFAGTDVCYLQAPIFAEEARAGRPFAVTQSFAHLLANVGWHDGRALFAVGCAWANLFSLVKPHLTVFDHAPTALLASRGMPMKRAVIGSGFCVPPDESPWPAFRRELVGTPAVDRIAGDEGRLLRRVNRLLQHWGNRPLERLGQLYSQADETFLTTLPELEQYPTRAAPAYWGPILPDGGEAPQWPAKEGKRVFAYLKRFDRLEPLAAALRDAGHPTVLYVEGPSETERRRVEGPTLRVEPKRIDLRRAAAECDAAVLHAGQGATAAMLLAGKPILQIPLVLEQRLTAHATARLGAGLVVPDRGADPAEAAKKLNAVLAEPHHTDAARRVAAKYGPFDADQQTRRIVSRLERLAAAPLGAGTPARGRVGVAGAR